VHESVYITLMTVSVQKKYIWHVKGKKSAE
jgi:hypothetical protein